MNPQMLQSMQGKIKLNINIENAKQYVHFDNHSILLSFELHCFG